VRRARTVGRLRMFRSMDTLTIGQLSDLHLRHHLPGTSAVPDRRSRDIPDLLDEALTALQAAHVDVVAVTGDLVDHPLDAADSEQSLRQGVADLELIAEALSALACPWFVLPGNHDHDELFEHVFGDRPRELDVSGFRVVAFHDWDRCLHESDNPDDVPENVPRREGDERDRFDSVLGDDDSRLQVHLQHYVITPRLDEGWPHTYCDGELLRDALVTDERVRLVLSGHYHPGVDSFLEGDVDSGTRFHVAPAFCQAPHPVLLHELRLDGALTTTRVDLRPVPVTPTAETVR